jgi:hypothetical protein
VFCGRFATLLGSIAAPGFGGTRRSGFPFRLFRRLCR